MKRLIKRRFHEPIECMATVFHEPTMSIRVNPDGKRRGEPYFKVYDREKFTVSNKCCRVSFRKAQYIYHKDSKPFWNMNGAERKKLIQVLQAPDRDLGMASVWMAAKYHWNNEYGLLSEAFPEIYGTRADAYQNGFYDTDERRRHPSYLPSDLDMPDYTKMKGNVTANRILPGTICRRRSSL